MRKPHFSSAQTKKPRHSDRPLKELKYYGVAACQSLWQKRPDDIIRIYLEEERLKEFSPLLKWAAGQRLTYHIVADKDLEKLTESIHHQGICILAREPKPFGYRELITELKTRQEPILIAWLDGVENPHNLGAILRSCAHFGIPYILGEAMKLPSASPSACRVAEGGAEYVKLVKLPDRNKVLAELRKLGFEMLTTAANGHSVYEHPFATRTIVVMGAEVTGVSKIMHELADGKIKLPGTGHVESLNVASAFTAIASEFQRQNTSHPTSHTRTKQKHHSHAKPLRKQH